MDAEIVLIQKWRSRFVCACIAGGERPALPCGNARWAVAVLDLASSPCEGHPEQLSPAIVLLVRARHGRFEVTLTSLSFMVFTIGLDAVRLALPKHAVLHQPDLAGETLVAHAYGADLTVVRLDSIRFHNDYAERSFVEYGAAQDIASGVATELECSGYLASVFGEGPGAGRVLRFGFGDSIPEEDLAEDFEHRFEPIRRMQDQLGKSLVFEEELTLLPTVTNAPTHPIRLEAIEERVDWETEYRTATNSDDRGRALIEGIRAGQVTVDASSAVPAKAGDTDATQAPEPSGLLADEGSLDELIRRIEQAALAKLQQD